MDTILLTPTEVHERTKIPLKTLERWRTERSHLDFMHLGRAVRYRERDVENWIRQSTIRVA